MGNFRIVIDAVGGHGVDRKAKEGEPIEIPPANAVHPYDSPDSIAKECVDRLKSAGMSELKASLIHWPGQESEVVDDLVNMKRAKGQF